MVGHRADRAVRARMGDRLVPLRQDPPPAGRVRGDDVRDAPGGLILLPFGLAQRPDPTEFAAKSLVAFAYLILVGSLIGFTAYVWLLHHVPLGTVSTYAYVNPVVAITLGVVFLDERVTWRIALGAAIVLASVAVVVTRESEAAVEPFGE